MNKTVTNNIAMVTRTVSASTWRIFCRGLAFLDFGVFLSAGLFASDISCKFVWLAGSIFSVPFIPTVFVRQHFSVFSLNLFSPISGESKANILSSCCILLLSTVLDVWEVAICFFWILKYKWAFVLLTYIEINYRNSSLTILVSFPHWD